VFRSDLCKMFSRALGLKDTALESEATVTIISLEFKYESKLPLLKFCIFFFEILASTYCNNGKKRRPWRNTAFLFVHNIHF
jgi:hypothetical protein